MRGLTAVRRLGLTVVAVFGTVAAASAEPLAPLLADLSLDSVIDPASVAPGTVSGIGGVSAVAGVGGPTGSNVLVEQTLIGNRVVDLLIDDQILLGPGIEDRPLIRQTLIIDSFVANRGILVVNQEAGILNQQANVVVVSVNGSSPQPQGRATTTATQSGNVVISSEQEREDRITDSFGDTVGIVAVNQSAGNLNQQANTIVLELGLAAGLDATAPLTANDLSQQATSTMADAAQNGSGPSGPRSDVVNNAFTDFLGVAQVAQSAGDGNVTHNAMSLSLGVAPGPNP